MPATFFIGDPHFGHQLVSDIRGFANTGEHDDAIIRKWRKQVKDDDLVYVMGDISGGGMESQLRALMILSSLPGRKRWIFGNHDTGSGIHKQAYSLEIRLLIARTFEKVNDFGHLSFNKRQILLSHFPYWSSQDGPERGHGRYEQFRLPDLGKILIHAHTHHTHPTDGSATGREIGVSWDAWRRLVDMGDIHKLILKMESTSLAEYASKVNEAPFLRRRENARSWAELAEPYRDI